MTIASRNPTDIKFDQTKFGQGFLNQLAVILGEFKRAGSNDRSRRIGKRSAQ